MRAIYSGRRFSLRRVLRWLVVVCVLPASLLCATLLYSVYQLQVRHVQQSTLLTAQSVIADLEREIAVIESGMKVLATSDELASDDLRAFHKRARDALAPGLVYNYILTDRQGHQVLNTLRPFGAELPTTGTPAQINRVFTERATVLTDLFVGPVTQKQALAMGVPVGTGDEVRYSLNIGLDPARISALIASRQLPDGWLVAILDSSGTIVGRSRDAARYVGQKAVPEIIAAAHARPNGVMESRTMEGIPVFTAYASSQPWGWTVVVGAPKEAIVSDNLQQVAWVSLCVALAIALGLAVAHGITRRVLASVHMLNEAAANLSRGEEVKIPSMLMTEADAVSQAILDAAAAMKKIRFFAEHDTLTELPNRLLFETVCTHDLALAQRTQAQCALLAVDLDHFKLVNDTLGHEAGDAVLQIAARRILQVIRTSDIAARIGGDEFLVFLNNASSEGTMETAQRIVDLLSAPYNKVNVAVSASVGVALFPLHGSTLRELSVSADTALYRAKNAGRKQALLASAPAAPAG